MVVQGLDNGVNWGVITNGYSVASGVKKLSWNHIGDGCTTL